MPLYEYECKCGNTFEELQKVDAEPPDCPKCNRMAKRKISLTSFELKGSGWYKDGYARGDQ